MYERFTDRARRIVKLARKRAGEPIRIPALLLALLDDSTCVGMRVLTELNVDMPGLRQKLQALLQDASEMNTWSRIEFDRVVQIAIEEASGLNHNYVGTESIVCDLFCRLPDSQAHKASP